MVHQHPAGESEYERALAANEEYLRASSNSRGDWCGKRTGMFIFTLMFSGVICMGIRR